MKIYKRLLLVLLLFALPLRAAEFERLKEFQEFASQQMKEDQVPGMTIGFVRWDNGNVVEWVDGFGYSDLENHVAATRDSAYRLGSVSKPLTATAILLLAQRGKIDLDAEVQTYVPYFPKKKWPVTVRQLLGHLGGISHYKNYDVEGRIKEHKSTREALAIFEQFDLVAEPGTKYSYSSYGYNLLAAVVEGASGKTFEEFMKENVWGPLEMNATELDDPTKLIPNRSRGYRILTGRVQNSEFVDISSRMGAGGTRSTVPDLLKFAKGVVEQKILSTTSTELMYSSMATRDGHFTDYSTGWGTAPLNGHFMLRHSGSQQETSTVLMCFPALKLAIACAINQEDAGATVFAQRLYELLMNERYAQTEYVVSDRNISKAMDAVFSSGMSYFEIHNEPLSSNPAELKQAFDYFRSSVQPGRDAEKRITSGSDLPSRSFTKAGSYIAKMLLQEQGRQAFQKYYANGAIPFFSDYLKTCEKKHSKNPLCDFSKSFRNLVSGWNESWLKTNSDEFRWIRFNTESNLDQAGPQIRKAFDHASAYPDYSRQLGDLTWVYLLKGEKQKSLQAGELGTALYPESARLLALYGISLAASSQKTRGIQNLKKAFDLDPRSPAEPDWLSDFAEELANAGKIQEAFQLMQAALELHPGNAGLLSDMGEAYLAMNDPAKAKEYFQKALQLDPNLERAKALLKKLEQ